MNKEKDSKEKNHRGLTIKQEKFLVLYPENLNVYRTADACGIARGNIMRDIQKDTEFGMAVRELTEDLDGDPRFSKAGTLSALYDMESAIENDEEVKAVDKYRLLLDIRKEINKMIDGNIASQKKTITNKSIHFEGVYDFTKLPEKKSVKTIDITHIQNET